MSLKEWAKANFNIVPKTVLASQAARQYLSDNGKALNQTTINKTIVELHDWGLLAWATDHLATPTRLVVKTC